MAIASIFPTIKPALSLDFANTKQLDPRITFSRATPGTHYDGKTFAKAEENLLTYSQEFYNAAWAKSSSSVSANTFIAPDGTSTADTLTASGTNGTLLQSFVASAVAYTFSVWIYRKTGTGNVDVTVDGTTWVTKTITAGWTRFDTSLTPAAGTKTAGVRLATSGDEVYLWGAQLEQRSTVTAYTPTTSQPITNYIPVLLTAPAGVARFDHNPVTGESLGLLIEESRANLLSYSSDFRNTADAGETRPWSYNQVSVVLNTVVAPDGTLSGSKLILSKSNSGATKLQHSVSTTASNTYTISYRLKYAGKRYVTIGLYETSSNNAGAGFDLLLGVPTGTSSIGTGYAVSGSPSISAIGNGWYLCSVAVTVGTATAAYAPIYLTDSAYAGGVGASIYAEAYAGDGYSGIYIWGAQLEAGSFATSYIPTTTAGVTRAADAASMTGTNFSSWYRQDGGCFLMDVSADGSGNNGRVQIDDGTESNRLIVAANVGVATEQFVIVGGTNQAVLNVGTFASPLSIKSALAYKVNDFSGVANGGSAVSDSSGSVPAVTTMRIGANQSATYGSARYKRLAYYPKRLTNAQLQALTA